MKTIRSNSTICTQCLLTEDTPGIVFDAKGVCNYCSTYETKLNVLGEDKLIDLLNIYKDKFKKDKYDCMVCISGGRDSTYTLYKLVKDYNMRVLCINYDNPFTSEQARINMQRAAEILKVDLIQWGYREGEQLNATKKALKVWSCHPSSLMIPVVCAHCKSLWPTFFRYARQNSISLIVIGSNPLETASFKKEWFGGALTYCRVSNIPIILKKSLRELVLNPRYLTLSWPLILNMYLNASHYSPYIKKVYSDIIVIPLFDYIKWNEKDVESTIFKELDWRQRFPEPP